jgi:TctA family transporter
MLELSLRQSLSMGGPMVFFTRPVPLAFIILTIVMMVISAGYLKRVSKTLFEDKSDI